MLRIQYTEDPDVRSVSLFQKLQGNIGDGRDLQIGRGLESDIVLDSRRVALLISRRHALLSRRGRSLFLQDLESTNGTYVNDVVLAHGERKLLQDGDTLSFGGARLLRQAHRDYDEPNPFNFKLTDMHRLFESGLPHAVPDAPSPPRREQPSAVIDLTVEDSPPAATGGWSAHERNALPRKRTRELQTAPVVVDDDFDSDADVRVLDSSDPPKKQPLQPPPPPSHSIFSDDEDAAAAGPSKAGGNALLAALEGQFECTICREFMVAAHSLVPCGHMFCGECVGEWILKKSSCPTCRAATTAAPVPCLSVDNMLDEVAGPQLDPDARRERDRRQAAWRANGKQLAARLKHRFAHGGGAGSAAAAAAVAAAQQQQQQHHSLSFMAGPQLAMSLHGFMQALPGAVNSLPATARPPRRASRGPPPRQPPRQQGRPVSGSVSGTAILPSPPRTAAPAAPSHVQNTFSFSQTGRTPSERCAVCGQQFLPHEGHIRETPVNTHLRPRAFHVRCDANVPGFMTVWRSSNGSLPGMRLLSSQDLARLQRRLPVTGSANPRQTSRR